MIEEITNTEVEAAERLRVREEETKASDKGSHFNSQRAQLIIFSTVLSCFFFFLIGIILWKVSCKKNDQLFSQAEAPVACGPVCPARWIGYERKCYFFSEEERNWTFGQNFCISHNSTLAVIESELEKEFILRYKGTPDHWIGLWKESSQAWKWADETEFNNTIKVQGKGGECAFLSTDVAIASHCHIRRNWICNHHDAYTWTKHLTVG